LKEQKMQQLTGKVALVTGAGSGIGKAAAQLMAIEGAKIGALGRTEDELQQTVDEIKKQNCDAVPLIADISDEGQMQQAVQKLVNQWGRLDIVFANAGINGVWAPIEDLTLEDWKKTLSINLDGTFLTVKYSVPHLKKQGGAIIITSSVNGTRIFSNTGATAYSTTKAGQVAFTKMIALELAKHRIRVNVICPGAIETQIEESTTKRNIESEKEPVEFPEGNIPLTDGTPGKSEQVAQAVLFLASDASIYASAKFTTGRTTARPY
jgi:NAD(P)-dependent dehydrogenase (short-subunit alcohol dehydrogenase family)